MAQLLFKIMVTDDLKLQDIIDTLAKRHGYPEEVLDAKGILYIPNPESKLDWLQRRQLETIEYDYTEQKKQEAKDAAVVNVPSLTGGDK